MGCTGVFDVGFSGRWFFGGREFRSLSSSSEYRCSYGEFKFHRSFQILWFMQPVVPALLPLGCGVGDACPAVAPSYLIAQVFHQREKLLPGCGSGHTPVNGIHQLEFPALASGGGVILPTGESGGACVFAFFEHWQVQLFADEVVLTAELFQFIL